MVPKHFPLFVAFATVAALLANYSEEAAAIVFVHPPVTSQGDLTYPGPTSQNVPISSYSTPASQDFGNGFSVSGDSSITLGTINGSATGTIDVTTYLDLNVNTPGLYAVGTFSDIFIGLSGVGSITSLSATAELTNVLPDSLATSSLQDQGPYTTDGQTVFPQALELYTGGGVSKPFQINDTAASYRLQYDISVGVQGVTTGEQLYLYLPGSGQLNVAPEPGTFGLFGLGAAALGAVSFRRRKHGKPAA